MTPQEFFDAVLNENSRYIACGYVDNILTSNTPKMLKLFVEDVVNIVSRWQFDERVRRSNDERAAYESEVERLNNLYVSGEIPQGVYNASLPQEPSFVNIPFPELPEVAYGAIEELKRGLGGSTDYLAGGSVALSDKLNSPEAWKLPTEVDTEGARKYFARAIEREFILPTSTGFIWRTINGRGGNSQLGYFLYKIYPQPRPITALERIFGVAKLSTYIGNACFEAKRSDVKGWRTAIDSIFND